MAFKFDSMLGGIDMLFILKVIRHRLYYRVWSPYWSITHSDNYSTSISWNCWVNNGLSRLLGKLR